MRITFPFYHQLDSMDCGPACLRMIAKYYGKGVSLQVLRERSQISKEGVNLLGISEAAESIGFRTRSVRLTYHSLTEKAKLPAILYWNQNHFIVLYKIRKKKFFIADPAFGITTLLPGEFTKGWIADIAHGNAEGVALLLEPSPAFFESNRNGKLEYERRQEISLKKVFQYIFPYKKLIFQLLIGLIVASILQLILPFLTQSIVDVGINTANLRFIYVVLLAQFALLAGRMVIEFVRRWILLNISTMINISILTDFLIKLMRLPVSFFDSRNTGDILQRINDHDRIELFLTGSSLNVIFSIFTLLIFSVVLLIYNGGIFTVFTIGAAVYAFWVSLFLKKRRILDYKRFHIAVREQSTTIQLVQSMQEIKLNGVERSMRVNWENLQEKLFQLSIKSLSLSQWQEGGAFFINEGKNILITFLSAKAVIDDHMTIGAMLAVQFIIGQLNSPIEQMISFVQSLQNAKISLERLNDIHTLADEEPVGKEFITELPLFFSRCQAEGKSESASVMSASPYNVKSTNSLFQEDANSVISNDGISISFQNVSFTYPGAGNEPVIKDINMKIPQGKMTAIVGVSGSGKTTLLKLLLKFYEPQKGEIKLGDISLANFSHKKWRSYCGVVMQESFIFSESIEKNIALGVEKVDKDRLMQAAKIANASDFIEDLPLGYNTRVGTEGCGLSLGQKQRILIARAVYRDPDFIFFDEATNSLDANNESEILYKLESFFKERTVVIVAHRLSTVKSADQIIVLHKGIIAERGTHQELISLRGEYFRLIKNQLELGQ